MLYRNKTDKILVARNYLFRPKQQVFISPFDEKQIGDFLEELIAKGKIERIDSGELMKANGKVPEKVEQASEEIIKEESEKEEAKEEEPKPIEKKQETKKRGRPSTKKK